MVSTPNQNQQKNLLQQHAQSNNSISGTTPQLNTHNNNFIITSPKNSANGLTVVSPRQNNSFFINNNNPVKSPSPSPFSPLTFFNVNNSRINQQSIHDIPSHTTTVNTNKETVNTTMIGETEAPKKLKYSRKGCTSCKKRRKKCSNDTGDGTTCWDCKRLGRECIYIFNPKNVKRKTTPRKRTTKKAVSKDELSEKSSTNNNNSNSNNNMAHTYDSIVSTTTYNSKPTVAKNNNEHFLAGLDLDEADVNLIFQNLNDIVSMKLNDSQLNFDDYNSISVDDVFAKNINKSKETSNNNNNKPSFDYPKNTNATPLGNGVDSVKQETFTPNLLNYNELVIEASGLSNFNRSPIAQSLVNPMGLNQMQSSLRDSPMPSTVGSDRKSPKAFMENIPTTVSIDSPITVNTPLESFSLGKDHDKYLKVFYHDCMDSIAPFTQHQINPLRDALLSFAKTEDYLLSSILAIGASISNRKKPLRDNKSESYSDIINGELQNQHFEDLNSSIYGVNNNYEDDDDDEKFYCQYLNHCLSLLSTQFQEEGKLQTKIEPIILTVILLAWDCVYSMNSQWRSHLKGVTKLFEKIDSDSKILNLCKCWFKVIETFAHISTVLGGSLVEDNDVDNIFNLQNETYLNSLRSLNVIIPLKSEFNLLRGHAESFDCVIREVIKNLNHIRKSEKNYFQEKGIFNKNLDYLLWNSTTTKIITDEFDDNLSYFRIQKILHDIDVQLEIEFINKSGIIPIEDPLHPLNPYNGGIPVKDFGVDLITLIDSQQIAISWYDISHQCQVLSFLLIVLMKFLGLPRDSIIIQEIVSKICNKFDWLLTSRHPPENLRTCYCNFAILLAGLNANQSRNRDIVRQYYKLNGKAFERLTKHNLLRLEKTWNKDNDDISNDEIYTLEGQDVLTW